MPPQQADREEAEDGVPVTEDRGTLTGQLPRASSASSFVTG